MTARMDPVTVRVTLADGTECVVDHDEGRAQRVSYGWRGERLLSALDCTSAEYAEAFALAEAYREPPEGDEPDTVVRGCDLVGDDAELEAYAHELGLRERESRTLRLRAKVAAMRGVWR